MILVVTLAVVVRIDPHSSAVVDSFGALPSRPKATRYNVVMVVILNRQSLSLRPHMTSRTNVHIAYLFSLRASKSVTPSPFLGAAFTICNSEFRIYVGFEFFIISKLENHYP